MRFFSRKLKFFSLIIFSVLLISSIMAGCKKEEEEVELAQVYGSASVNGAFNTFTRADFYIIQEGSRLKNFITLSRTNNTKVRIIFYGTEEGVKEIGSDSLKLEYVDANARVFRSDSGKVVIDEYINRDGTFKVSGGFSFVANYNEIYPETTIVVKTTVENGAFINIVNN
jgi:hypothetical protein